MKKGFVSLLALLLLVGCAGAPASNKINVYSRDSSSGTREGFEKNVGFKGELTSSAIEVSGNDDMASKVGSDVNGIGYASLTTDFEKNNVKPLQYEGVSASNETVMDGSYKLQRPFCFVTRAKGDFKDDRKEQLIQAFLDFIQNSSEAKEIIQANGGEVDVTKATPWSELATKYPVLSEDNADITINCVGSTSVEKTLKACLEDFSTRGGNFKFALNLTGSSDGWKRVLGSEKDGANSGDIGFASRNFDDKEPLDQAMVSGTYAIDAIVTIVNKENARFESLSQEQLKQIFKGEITEWENVK